MKVHWNSKSHQRTEGSCALSFVLNTRPVYEHWHFEKDRFEWARLSHMIPLLKLVIARISFSLTTRIVYKKTDEWSNEWQRLRTSGTTSDNEWQRVVQRMLTSGTTNTNEWYNEWQRVTTSDNEWNERQRVIENDNEWQRMTAIDKTNENEWE